MYCRRAHESIRWVRFALLLCISLLSASLSTQAFAVEGHNPEGASSLSQDADPVFEAGGITYTVTGEAEVVVGAQSSAGTAFAGSGSIRVPAQVSNGDESYTVVGVSDYAFSDGATQASQVISLSLPETVRSIGKCAFYGCSDLTDVEFPSESSLATISDMAFANCSSLKSVHIPKSVRQIGQLAFSNCSGLTSLEFQDPKATEPGLVMGASAFRTAEGGDNALKSVLIPARLRAMPARAFEWRSALERVEFAGGALSGIGDRSFYGCAGLEYLEIPSLTSGAQSLSSNAFFGVQNLKTIVFLGDEDFNINDNFFPADNARREGIAARFVYPDVREVVYYGTHTSALFENANHYERISYYESKLDAEQGLNTLGGICVRDDVPLFHLAENASRADDSGPFVFPDSGTVPDVGKEMAWCYPGASLTTGAKGPVAAYPVDKHDVSAGEITFGGGELVYAGQPLSLSCSVIDATGVELREGKDVALTVTNASGAVVDASAIQAT